MSKQVEKNGLTLKHGWFEAYRCGCVSDFVRTKRELTGYCLTHGEGRRVLPRPTAKLECDTEGD